MTGGQRFNIEESAKKKWSPGEEIEAVQLIQAHIPACTLASSANIKNGG